jgi:hypothetical protein
LDAEKQFPQVRVGTAQLEGVWLASPIVAVGEVSHIISYGHQAVSHLPPPTSPEAHDLYWCQGDLSLVAVVKGQLRGSGRKYLWASTIPGCKLVDDNPKLIYHGLKTKFWFLRDERQFLRPTFDYGAHRFEGVFTPWSQGPPLPARQRLGALLLMPSANSDSLDDYARYLWNVGDIACELLGKSECARRIRLLEQLGNPALTESACGFLKGQLGNDLPGKVRGTCPTSGHLANARFLPFHLITLRAPPAPPAFSRVILAFSMLSRAHQPPTTS